MADRSGLVKVSLNSEERLQSGTKIHLEALAQPGLCLYSGMADDGKVALGSASLTSMGWEISLFGKGRYIQSGSEVHLRGLKNETYLHDTVKHGGGFRGGGPNKRHGWIIESAHGGGDLHDGDAVMLRGISSDKPGDGDRYLHSSSRHGEGFSLGGRDPEMGWRVRRIGPSSSRASNAASRQMGGGQHRTGVMPFRNETADYDLHVGELTREANRNPIFNSNSHPHPHPHPNGRRIRWSRCSPQCCLGR